jgi:queuine/archaeosine tRNA-ribosyltransferase
MPVGTLGSVKGMSQDSLEELGVRILLGNTYHLYLRPGVDIVRRMGGLHGFMSWNRAILTDSGGFQVFSLNELRKVTEEGVTFRSHLDGSSHFLSPERAMEIQIGLGADIIMAFDECTEHPAERERVRSSMEMTLRWARRSKEYFEAHKNEVPWGSGQWAVAGDQKTITGSRQLSAISHQDDRTLVDEIPRSARNDNSENRPDKGEAADRECSGSRQLATGDCTAGNWQPATGSSSTDHGQLTTDHCTQSLFGIVQGGMDRELRRESALRTIEIGFPGYAIGGLSVGEPRELTREIVESTLEHLPSGEPRYLMGVGTPEEIALYARMGVDMMDCVLPTRAARHGLLFTSEGRVSIKQARYAEDRGPLDPACNCPVCRRYSRAYLRHLYASNELLAQVLNTQHNLHFYLETMHRVREEIKQKT